MVETLLGIGLASLEGSNGEAKHGATAGQRVVDPDPKFRKPQEVAVAKLVLGAIGRAGRDAKAVPGTRALQSEAVQKRLLDEVVEKIKSGPPGTYEGVSQQDLAHIVREATAVYIAHTIAIPRVIVHPTSVVRSGFREFTLDLSALRLEPVSEEIVVQHLASETRQVIGSLEGGRDEERLEDYVVRALIDFDDVSYDEQADLLYKLAEQVVAHLRSYLKDDDEVQNVLLFHQRQISALVHSQMQPHAWEEASSYEAVISQGFSEARAQSFEAPADEKVRNFVNPVADKINIRKMLFGGFKKCLYPTQKFDSDPERRFAGVLEADSSVIKWFKPGKGVFKIHYVSDDEYEPDFVVESESVKFLCEPKRADQLQDPVVLAKAEAAATWCCHASSHEVNNGGKPWKYLLIPHDAITDNTTLNGFAKSYTFSGTK